ncbi:MULTISPECIES: hypothetical protein [Vitreoscilla]|uniref:Uncharacterized protein n=1 Tax=Vitreoscilla stercoraria TaxID=61 RepID=A0ABY4E9Q1_VITST|nr:MULTISPECIES: hypothetical protein [Vitreoscilla]AUZ04658.1 hypothetical protein ADP71_09420 [Vitreoscilla sp. C1]UOO91650.1 hypothetical protein LVJ81_08330 [Vitreoscilla stercoraria]
MQKYILMSMTMMLCGHVAWASPLSNFGKQACLDAVNGKISGFDSAQYRKNLAEDGLSRDEFCRCTGTHFENNALYQMPLLQQAQNEQEEAQVMADILKTNMAGCFVSRGG